MAKNSIRDFDATSSNNTDIQSVDISEGCSPAGINNAIRELMADIKDVSAGTIALESPSADSLTVTGDLTVDTNTLFVDASADAVGIGTDSPVSTSKLDVRGRIQVGNSDDVSMASDARGHIRIQGNGYGAAITCDATGMHVYHNASGKSLVFGTNDTERGRFDGSGNLLVGRTGTSIGEEGILLNGEFGYLIQERNYSGSGNFVIYNQIGTGANNILFQYQGATKGSINWTSSSTNYNTSSDYRLKENIVDAPSSSSDIDAIQVRSFDWKVDGSHQKYGMIAQELLTVAPEAVSQPEDSEEMMGVDYSKLVPMMIKEIQTLRQRITDLENA